MTVKQRMSQPTPPFFKKVRNIGLLIASIGAALLTAPMEIPPILATIAGYFTVAGTVASTISQATSMEEGEEEKQKQEGEQSGS